MTFFEYIFGTNEQIFVIFTWIIYSVICQIINIFGVVTNVINIICFVKQGYKDSVNISLLGLSISDLGSLITMICTSVCLTPSVLEADLPFEPLDIAYLISGMPHLSFTRVSSCITAMVILEICLSITIPLKIKTIITPKRTGVITTCIFMTFFTSAPMYAVNSLKLKFSPLRNKTLVGRESTGNREQVEKVSFIINNCSIPFSAFVIIGVCTAILLFKLNSNSQWRRLTINTAQSNRISSRNQKTATLVVMISALFIVCFIPMNAVMLVTAFIPDLAHGNYRYYALMAGGIGYVLESINSSMNIFIYYHMSSNYRDQVLQFVASKTKNI